MRPAMSALRAWQPDQLLAAAAALARRVDEFDDAMDAVGKAADTVSQSWRGAAADRAGARIAAEATIGNRVSVAGLEVVEVLNNGLRSIQGHRAFILGLEARLLMSGVRVGEDGEIVSALSGRPEHEGTAALLRAGLDQLDDADRDLANALGGALETLAGSANYIAGQGLSKSEILAKVGEIPGDAAGLSALWRALSAADRVDLLVAMPELGVRAGMPAATRDFYNRERLEELLTQASAERDRLGVRMDQLRGNLIDWDARNEWPILQQRHDSARTRAAGYEAVAAQLAGEPRALLMDIDSRGRGAIALNNPDTATHVTTLVPGTGAKLSRIGREVDRTRVMLEAAEEVSPGATHSVIAWTGYDAPPGVVQAMDRGYAERGAGLLRDFQSGLRASHVGADAHSTVVGHSYGTTEIGAAASRGHSLDADSVVFLASPGTTVNHVTELSLTGVDAGEVGDHVYSTKGATDPIPMYASMGAVVNTTLDAGAVITRLAAPFPRLVLAPALDGIGDFVKDRYPGPFGVDPTDRERFGGRTFTSDPGSRTPIVGWNPETHSQHWEVVDGQPNLSLKNLAHIMSGQGDLVS